MSDLLVDMTREVPISMSPPMALAILQGRKTVTRRTVRPQPLSWELVKRKPYLDHTLPRVWSPLADRSEDRVCPYGVNDKLWVREAWQMGTAAFGAVRYKSSWTDKNSWCAPITMPRWAARLWLEVTAIGVERLQEITTEGCIAEGLTTSLRESEAEGYLREQYQKLWDRINRMGGSTWDTNPWVWVISFRRINWV